MMKYIYSIFAASVFAFLISACGSAPVEPAPAPVEPEPVIEEPAPAPVEPEPVIEEPAPAPGEPEPVVEEPAPVEEVPEEPAVVEEPVPEKKEEDEYQRSTTNVSVTKETFVEDKARIIQIIKDLDLYMKNGDFKGWVSYLSPESYSYWSKRPNLSKASQRLPKKGLRLNSIEDYFKFVFIPARKGHTVNEIRYDTQTEVNVVQAEDDKDIVYYSFTKINDKWKLVLPKNPS
ncbi:MAG: hypothetical protein SPJ89_12790 [Treponema sp.]|nr:hypothetical protein [Spirochaetia bacterium]MDD7460798.1 hypothetical protein [Spirochaetales bacterium]MDY5812840.1 hypothetical protein [Treponema sp.]